MQSGPARRNFDGGYISGGRALKTLEQMDWDDECGPVGQPYDKPFGFSIVPRGPRRGSFLSASLPRRTASLSCRVSTASVYCHLPHLCARFLPIAISPYPLGQLRRGQSAGFRDLVKYREHGNLRGTDDVENKIRKPPNDGAPDISI